MASKKPKRCAKAYSEGRKAMREGWLEPANPYAPGTPDHGLWKQGWNDENDECYRDYVEGGSLHGVVGPQGKKGSTFHEPVIIHHSAKQPDCGCSACVARRKQTHRQWKYEARHKRIR